MLIRTGKAFGAVLVAATLILTACGESQSAETAKDPEREIATDQIRRALKNHPDFRVLKTIYGDYLGCPSSGFGPSVVYLKETGTVYAMNGIARGNYKNLPTYEGPHLTDYIFACSSSPDKMEEHPVIAKASSGSPAQKEQQDNPATSGQAVNDEELKKARSLIPAGTKHEQLILDEVAKGYVTAKEIEIYFYMKNRFETYIARDGKYEIDKHDPLVFKDAEAKFGLSKEQLSDIYWRLDQLHEGLQPKESVTLDSNNTPVEITIDRIRRTNKNELEVTVTNHTKKNITLPTINLTFDLYKDGQKVGYQIVWLEDLKAGTKKYTSLPIRYDFDSVEGRAFMNVDDMIRNGLKSAYESGNKRGETVVQLLQTKPYSFATGNDVAVPQEKAAQEAQEKAVQEKTATVPSSAESAKRLKLPEGVLKPGSAGDEVKLLQEALLQAGEQLPKSGADGRYGHETVEAVKSLQKKFDLTPDGIYGPNTRRALQAKLAGAVQIDGDHFSLGNLKLGMSGSDVVRILGNPIKTEKDGYYDFSYIYPGMTVGVDGGKVAAITHIADNPGENFDHHVKNGTWVPAD